MQYSDDPAILWAQMEDMRKRLALLEPIAIAFAEFRKMTESKLWRDMNADDWHDSDLLWTNICVRVDSLWRKHHKVLLYPVTTNPEVLLARIFADDTVDD